VRVTGLSEVVSLACLSDKSVGSLFKDMLLPHCVLGWLACKRFGRIAYART